MKNKNTVTHDLNFAEQLKSLVIPDRDTYQSRLSYEQRVDNFNKYGVGVTGHVFYPLYALTKYLRAEVLGSDITKLDQHNPDPYSHSARLLEITNLSESTKALQYDEKTERIVVLFKVQAGWRILACWDLKNMSLYIPMGKTLPLTLSTFESIPCEPLNKEHLLFQKLNQWLIDFGYIPMQEYL